MSTAMPVWNWEENAWKLGRSERNPCTGTQTNSRPARITSKYWLCLKDSVVKKYMLFSTYNIIHEYAFTQLLNSVLRVVLDQCCLYVRIHLKVKDTVSGLWPNLHSDMTSIFTFTKAVLSLLHTRPFVGNWRVQRTGRFSSPQRGTRIYR